MRSEVSRWRSPSCVLLLALGGCASVDPRPDYQRATEEIRATTGATAVHDPERPVLSDEEIRTMLADGLGLEEAARLALLNNRRLQAGFMGLGVARSELVQSGLLANPSLSLAFLFPDTGGRVRWTADLVASVSDLWSLSSREQVARAGLEQRILELSRFAGELVFRTKDAYVESVAAREARSIARASADLARRSLEGVRRRVEAGVATTTDESLATSVVLEAERAELRAEREESDARRALGALLSLRGDPIDVALTDPLVAPAPVELDSEALVARCLRDRPDLRAAARSVAAAEAQVDRERARLFPRTDAGLSVERPEGGSTAALLLGPGATVAIPLFDQNQAQVSRAAFLLAEARKELEALEADAGQEVRAAADRASIAARAARFADEELIPNAERGAALAERSFELGDTILLSMLQSRRTLLEARSAGIETLRESARSRFALERVLGAPLDTPRAATARR